MEIKKEIKLLSKIKNEVSARHGILFNAYISGSHLYGWESKDSDFDIRGSFVLGKEEFLGLKEPIQTIEIQDEENLDIVLFEIKKVITLALKGNCNILEEVNAPQIYKNADFVKLKQLLNNAFGKRGIYNSYRGLAEFNYKKFILSGKNTLKKYLYVFRGLMSGIFCLETGMVQPNIEQLNKRFKIKEITKLLEMKRKGLEDEPLRELETGVLDKIIKELFEKLDSAYLKSKIPEVPDGEDINAIHKFLIHLRK